MSKEVFKHHKVWPKGASVNASSYIYSVLDSNEPFKYAGNTTIAFSILVQILFDKGLITEEDVVTIGESV